MFDALLANMDRGLIVDYQDAKWMLLSNTALHMTTTKELLFQAIKLEDTPGMLSFPAPVCVIPVSREVLGQPEEKGEATGSAVQGEG